ncbi:hypothetical protein BJV82DRAFT_620601 [Fennellomyces sp. T-0311]|nr:hypothetical protein BJV82DRAFT_620601 [Fennellomyces sp. T-0311]
MMDPTSQDRESIKEKPIKKEHHVESDAKDTKNKQDILKEGTEDVEHLKEAKVNSKIATTTTTEPDAPTAPDTAETKDRRRVRHPQLGDQHSYYIDKEGVLYTAYGTGVSVIPRPRRAQYAFPLFRFMVNKKVITIRLNEVMVETFLGPMVEGQYIIHKDGDKDNLALSNLAVGDLDTLRKFQIEHLKKVEPDMQFVRVKDLDDTLTFDDYIISNTGILFCLSKLRRYTGYTRSDGYASHSLQSDPQDGISIRKTFLLHRIVFHSFHGRLTNDSYLVYHVNGDRSDNSSDNLKCGPRRDISCGAYAPANKAARRRNMELGLFSRQNKAMVEPLPPITEQTKWKTIGVLPWNGQSFNSYQVSDTGHVQRVDGAALRLFTQRGYLRVRLVPDDSDQKQDDYLALVSRLVAYAFVDGYSETTCHAMHLNKNIRDNRAENLKWVESYTSRSRKVIVTLVDDPTAVKEYPNMTKAKQDLGTSAIYPIDGGGSYVRQVRWDGVMRHARVHVL